MPQDPTDEPASVLIEQIRLEKEQLIKDKKNQKDKNELYIFRRDNSHYEKLGTEGTLLKTMKFHSIFLIHGCGVLLLL